MSNYAALTAAWNAGALPAGVTGEAFAPGDTTAQKLAKINAWTVPGPAIDVPVASVVAYLALNLKMVALQTYAASPPAGADARAVIAAKELVALLAMPNAPPFGTSNPAVLKAVTNLLNLLAADANTGITVADVTALLALAQSPAVPWWQVPDNCTGGAPAPIAPGDLGGAKLVPTAQLIAEGLESPPAPETGLKADGTPHAGA